MRLSTLIVLAVLVPGGVVAQDAADMNNNIQRR